MDAVIYNSNGDTVGKIKLPEELFNLPWNASLVNQVVNSQRSNARMSTAHTKDRSEVRGGGKKPWAQKGTGQARHGSIRSPIWRGGGITFGPRSEKDYSRKISKSMRAAALHNVLSKKFRDGEVLFVEELSFATPKTAEAKKVMRNLAKAGSLGSLTTKKRNALLLALGETNEAAKKSVRNMGNVEVEDVRNINPMDLLTYRYVIITHPEKSVELLRKGKKVN